MPAYQDFQYVQFQDGVLVINLQPPQPIGGWDLLFKTTQRPGGTSGLILKSIVSGLANGASGITIANSGNGTIQVQLNSADTSGLTWNNFFYSLARTNSGHLTTLCEGYLSLVPGGTN